MIILDPSERNNPKVDEHGYFMTPAEYVVFMFGNSVRGTAKALGRSPQSVCEWYDPKTKRGGRGCIPSSIQAKILEIAKERGLDINANDLILGRKVKIKYE